MESLLAKLLHDSEDTLSEFYSRIREDVVWDMFYLAVGGQHVNSSRSDIRLTYKGIVTECYEFRSVHLNRQLCLLKLMIELNK